MLPLPTNRYRVMAVSRVRLDGSSFSWFQSNKRARVGLGDLNSKGLGQGNTLSTWWSVGSRLPGSAEGLEIS